MLHVFDEPIRYKLLTFFDQYTVYKSTCSARYHANRKNSKCAYQCITQADAAIKNSFSKKEAN